MYFKSLELFGFKSFAGKTKIDFEPGITAIVGPNGCGKSNVVDSLKWVLGEQSAKDLRGLNMEDVIFNGTDTRDPVGFAEVSLTLSNESKFLPIEYDEVIITRRLFRSGESEYLLNKNQVRLKDIVELFMGTGVGTSAYSIIEQGKIDMIISSKPEDRRYIFEEASGIIKYKSKKREAIRKLEYTENNLLRINDILLEVKRQIGSIERQAKKAERYKEEFERLKTLDLKAASREFKRLAAEKETAEKDISRCQDTEAEFLKITGELNSKLADLKEKQAAVQDKLSEAQFQELNLNSTVERSQDKVKMDEERLTELDALKQTLLNEQAVIQKGILELEEVVSSLNKERDAISGNRAEKETALGQKEAQFKGLEDNVKQNEQNIRSGKLKMVDVLNAQSKAKNDLAKLSSDVTNCQARMRRLKIEEEKVKIEETQVRGHFEEIGQQVQSLQAKMKYESEAKASLQGVLNQKDEEIARIEKRCEELNANRVSLESKLSVLKDMVKRYEGFGGGSRAILIEKQESRLNINGVYGALAELINVKKGYEIAVEATLGGILQCIVVENKGAALGLINYLKQKNLGKVTVVSLDSLDTVSIRDAKLEAREGILGKLADFIEVEERFRGLISTLFDNVYLARDLETALNFKNAPEKNIKFVTLAGETFENGFITGGATKDDVSSGILSRKIQIRDMEKELGSIKNESVNLESRKEVLIKETDIIVNKINGQEEALRQCELELANRESQADSIEAALKKITDELSLLMLELEEVEEEINILRTRQTTCEAELRRLDEESAGIQSLISGAQSFIDSALKEKEGLLIAITKMRTELSTVAQQENNFVENLNMRSTFLVSQKELLTEKQRGFNEAATRQEELKNELTALKSTIVGTSAEKEKIVIVFQEIKEKKAQLDDMVSQTEAEFKTKEKELNAIKDTLHNSRMALQENSFTIAALKTRINQAYKEDIEQLTIEVEENIDWSVVTTEVEELRQKIEKMGPVNLVAIEEHQELRERYDFLTKQQEDLVSAKETLLEAIKKINKTTRELFMDTFQKVRVEFKEYFKFLFGGGQAELVLMDEQDILECGIEIMARPPGKKLQSISLLSGGEKALCAGALLFSIFKIKPSPFCILDEVDAPLDESNIGRFSKALAEFAKTSQFIVITHNKRTMSMADVMYGITMEQSGVSKIVSVKFAKDKEAALNHAQGG